MSDSARVHSLDALKDLRTALLKFGTEASSAVSVADLEIRRVLDGLRASLSFWQAEVRRCQDEVVRAKSELSRRRWGHSEGRGPGQTEAEIVLKKAQARLRHAEEKVEITRNWLRTLPQEVQECEGPLRQLAGFVEADLRHAAAVLDMKIAALEAYVSAADVRGSPDPAPPAEQVSQAPTPKEQTP